MSYERKDHYFMKAKKEGLRARSSFKLIEIAKKYQLINCFKGKQGFVLNIPIVRLISEAKTRKANDIIDINNYKYIFYL